MKKQYLVIVLLAQSMFSQAPAIQWQRTFGGNGFDQPTCIQPTPDGGYVMAVNTDSNNGDILQPHGNIDCWVVKMAGDGQIQWQKSIGGTDVEGVSEIITTSDGSYVLVGYTKSVDGDSTGNHGNADLWIVKLTAAGGVEWQKTYGGSEDDNGNSIQQTQDGGYIVVGNTYSADGDVTATHLNGDWWILKVSATGTIEWQKTLGGDLTDQALRIKISQNGSYLITGDTRSSNGDVTNLHGSVDCWVVKVSESGVIEWQKTLGGSQYEQSFDLQPTADGGCIIEAYTNSMEGDVTENHGGFDYWVVKLSNEGSIDWQKTFGGSQNDMPYSIQSTSDGGYLISGSSDSQDGDLVGALGNTDCWLIKVSNTGQLLWQKVLGGTGYDKAIQSKQTADGWYIMVGTSTSIDNDVTQNQGYEDAWVVKLTPDALSMTTYATQQFKLVPNPVTTMLTLLGEPKTTFDKITITDLTGKILLQQTQNTTQINVAQLASGMYIVEAYSGKDKWTSRFAKE